jgi:predicted dehydrogenase
MALGGASEPKRLLIKAVPAETQHLRMVPMAIRLGIIGISEGNGHPFSFSSIINGYSDSALAASGWPGIYDYVRRRDPSEFGFDGVEVTHAWTQNPEVTRKLCESSRIPHSVTAPEDLIGKVDGVIIARDDYENHFSMALPFLKAGLHVCVDKPLSIDTDELRVFRKYLENGKLMSCAGMRYARELDEPRSSLAAYGEVRLIRGAILNSWEKYGVHLLDAILNVVQSRPVSIAPIDASHVSLAVRMDDGALLQLDALGDVTRCFRIDIFGTKHISSHEITDNFSMFRRLLWHFVQSMKTGLRAIEPDQTLTVMRLLIAGRIAYNERRKVLLNDIHI